MTILYLMIFPIVLLSTFSTQAVALTGTFSLQFENDRFANTDRHYTHGTRLAWVSDKSTDEQQWIRGTLEAIHPADMRGGRFGLALGQNIYTPENIKKRTLVTDDRPYASWLYIAPSLHLETTRQTDWGHLDILDSIELSLGIVGPHSFGQDIQNGFHDLIGVSQANGWNNQLKDELTVNLFLERTWRPEPINLLGLEADILPHIGVSFGNVLTMTNLGFVLRFGHNMDLDFGPPHIRPTLSGLGNVEVHHDFGWYLFAGIEGRAILHNIFLDGNSFIDSHSVDKRPFTGDLQLGAAFLLKGIRLAYTVVSRTKEFKGQRQHDIFAAVNLSKHF